MSLAAFIDANIPIYASGREHPNKEPCARVLRIAAEHPRSFVTNVEILQELMHRYRASGRWALGREVLQSFAKLMHGRIEPVYEEDIHMAARLADRRPGISARDLVHAAVMGRLGVDRIISADTNFDQLPDFIRLDPAYVGEWAASLLTRERH